MAHATGFPPNVLKCVAFVNDAAISVKKIIHNMSIYVFIYYHI